jgi:hypothetical protein
MPLNIPYSTKINQRSVGQSISSEGHIIGIVGTATYASGFIRLVEVPQGPAPAVTIPGYTEITSGTPTGMQFLVDYTNGVITFATSQNGNAISASYIGLGSEPAAEDVNEIQNPLSTIAAQSIMYNWPAAPTVTWSLASNIVTPSSITNVSTDDFTFPRDVYITRNLIPDAVMSTSINLASTGFIRLANNSDSISWRNAANTADLALAVNASNQLTFNGVPIESNTLTSSHIFVGNGSNVATDTAMTGDVSISNTGVTTIQPAVVTGSKIASATITNTNISTGVFSAITGVGTQTQALNMGSNFITNVTDPTSAQEAATKHYVDSNFLMLSGGTLTGALGIGESPVASAVLDVASTTQGFLPPRMTSTQRTAISSPAEGLIVYDTTEHQWYGMNNSSWVILG